jgi:hypothetical protein
MPHRKSYLCVTKAKVTFSHARYLYQSFLSAENERIFSIQTYHLFLTLNVSHKTKMNSAEPSLVLVQFVSLDIQYTQA